MVKTVLISFYILLYSTYTDVRISDTVVDHRSESKVEGFITEKECEDRAKELKAATPEGTTFKHGCASFTITHTYTEGSK